MYSLSLKASYHINKLGIKKKEAIMVMVDNPEVLIPLWIGSAFLGIQFIAINTSLRGSVLAHQIEIASPKAIFVESKYNHEINKIKITKKYIKIVNLKDFILKKKIR